MSRHGTTSRVGMITKNQLLVKKKKLKVHPVSTVSSRIMLEQKQIPRSLVCLVGVAPVDLLFIFCSVLI